MKIGDYRLDEAQLRLLRIIFTKGAEDASRSMSKWLRGGVRLVVDEVNQVPLSDIVTLLGEEHEMLVACVMGLSGRLGGSLVLAFDDVSGRRLAEVLLQRPIEFSDTWEELEISAVKETTNIVGCSYLNSLTAHLPPQEGEGKIVPSPPEFVQDYTTSLLQSLFLEQAMLSDQILAIRTQFRRDQEELDCHLMFIPDLPSLAELGTSLGK
ncbi:CheY-P phosphatase CheC [Planctomycetes bacterium Pan216]|uniref:CheY-P phosphatase CheC n=1 Tax=Kolteria novifilia TaxID=2527975 RepID=A0A518BCP2_9BACT|nr:CheY-P phosphatase CheC [Planctomycetes bacterium Pan216]